MNDDIRSIIDRAIPDSPPPSTLDVDGFEAKGAKAVRRRRLVFISAATTTVSAFAAAALILPNLAVPASPDQSSPDSAAAVPTQKEFALPDLDPDLTHYWQMGEIEETENSQILTDFLLTHFEKNLADTKAVALSGDTAETVDLGAKESPFKAGRADLELLSSTEEPKDGEYPDGEVIFDMPIYTLGEFGINPFDPYYGAGLATDGTGEEQTDLFSFTVFPPGGYVEGTDESGALFSGTTNGYLADGCEEYDITDAHEGTDDDRTFSFECDETDGPNGEKVLAVTGTHTYTDAGVDIVSHTVVSYRADGTAVRVSDSHDTPIDWTQGSQLPNERVPSISLADLTTLALATPDVIIE